MKLFDQLIAASLPIIPKSLVGRFARPYLGGEILDDMTRTVDAVNAQGFICAVSILGEFVARRKDSGTADIAFEWLFPLAPCGTPIL